MMLPIVLCCPGGPKLDALPARVYEGPWRKPPRSWLHNKLNKLHEGARTALFRTEVWHPSEHTLPILDSQ
jgi:hypothetical protein